ncbi:Retrovirus-related Pol polyprotein from transposon RE1 [Vitis vinifera]|uniref:Retrovirus-related Pol polyprotein from transposon RE1 n=1 Tax=Vitis vinifera TaxID=29760 RepID=A0A438DKY4_VITVI|nr:Retrovirus-related Pol polyprotein from transposon RE1 [Vitis vinifera]
MVAQTGNNHESSQSATHEIHSSMGPVDAFDNSPLHLIIEKLNDKNYREWAQAIKLVIDGKGKLGLLTISHWQDLHVPPTTKNVWDAIRETYSDVENASQIFEIKMRLWQMKQGDREVTEYYTEMSGLWQDLDLNCKEEWECTGDNVCFKKKMENEKVFEFLARLNRELDNVRSRVLSCRSLPSIREVFSEVRREESRRRVMLDLSFGPEASTLLTRGPHGPHAAAGRGPHARSSGSHAAGSSGPSPRQSKRTYCEHCKKPIIGEDDWQSKEREGLYYFDETDVRGQCPPTVCNSASHLKDKGHLNLGGDTELQTNRETLVYSRRPKSKFNETLISEVLKESEPVIVPILRESGSNSDQVTNDLPIALRKQLRSCTLHPISKFVSYNTLSAKCHAFTTNLDRIQIPKNIQEALEIPKWKEAVMEEIRALEKNGTWEVMNLPRGKKPMDCKWVFTVKYKANGTVERYKARLVAKGFTQTYGIDYTETFAPVAKLNTIRVLLSLVANLNWPLHQFDIKNAFLNGELEEEVFMMLPPGFYKKEEETRVCKLKKSLYGHKQSPKAWFDRFTKVIKNQGYQQGQSDHTMFFKQSNDGRMIILIVYIDDIILTGDDTGEVERLKKVLATEFEVKDLAQMRYFLGMEVARSRKGISISQRKYVLDLLTETGMLGCKPNDTPIKARKRTESDEKPVDREKYQRLVDRLIYLSHTRPNIAFVVSVVSQYMHSPKESHLEAAYKILRHLKGSPRRGLFFKKSDSKKVEIYTDAD